MNPVVLELQAGALRLALRPDLGGCIAGFWHGALPVLQSHDPATLAAARPSACFPLVPYSNRLGHRRFSWQGQDHTTAPNFGDSPHSLHGTGWLQPWAVQSCSATGAVLRLAHRADAHWPFDFEAVHSVELTPQALLLRMAVRNTDARVQPLGLGWHPYFPKRPRSRLHAACAARWESDALQLPVRRVPTDGVEGDVAALDLDHCFEGWSGTARLHDEALSLRLTSDLPYLVVYTPPLKDFCCVEPVSHLNDAIHRDDPAAHGLRAAAPGAVVEGFLRLEVTAL